MYEMICASTQGADHIKHGMPCEDFGQVAESELCRIFAVADGHGDSNCPRSSFGSRNACNIAIAELEEFCKNIKDNDWESKILEGGKEQEKLLRQLIRSIVAKWGKVVNEDIEENPLTEEERKACEKYIERYDKGERLEHIYGTTLIAGLMTEDYLLLLQQGDGRCVVFGENGAATQPIPWDDKCFANVTTSLCDEDAAQKTRFYVVDLKKEPVIACLAGSDGVEDSFPSMDLMHTYYRELLAYAAENGVEALNEHLKEDLPDFSKTGSGDDVTICGFADKEKLKELTGEFARDNEIVRKESVIREIEGRLKSMNGMGKMEALKKKCGEAQEKVDKAQKEYDIAEAKWQQYSADLEEMQNDETGKAQILNRLMETFLQGEDRMEAFKKKGEELKAREEKAREDLRKAKDSLIPVRQAYEDFVSRKEAYEKELEEAKQELAGLKNPAEEQQ